MHHLASVLDDLTQTATRIKTYFCVDVLLLGAHLLGEASRRYNEAHGIMLGLGIGPRKWVSTSDELRNVFDKESERDHV